MIQGITWVFQTFITAVAGVLNQTSTPEPQQPDTFQQQQGQQIINQQPTPPPISGFQGDNNYQQPGPASSSSSDHQQQQQQQIRVASNTAPLSPIQPSMAGSGNSNSGSDSNYQSVSLYSIIGNDNLLTTGKVTFVAPSLGGMFFTATDVRTVTPIVVSPGILTSISRAEAFFIPISNTRVPGERTRISYYYAQGSPGNQQAGSGGSSGKNARPNNSRWKYSKGKPCFFKMGMYHQPVYQDFILKLKVLLK